MDDAASRKATPLAAGLLDYFPAALMAVARLSLVANSQHNPGQSLRWDRAKSGDHADALLRHLIDRGAIDSDGMRHSAKVAWRALAILQEECEHHERAPLPKNVHPPIIPHGLAAEILRDKVLGDDEGTTDAEPARFAVSQTDEE